MSRYPLDRISQMTPVGWMWNGHVGYFGGGAMTETAYIVTSGWEERAEFATLEDAQGYVRDLYTQSEHLARMPEELQILRVERTVLETHKRPTLPRG